MQFTTLNTITLLLSLATANPVAAPVSNPNAEPDSLVARACNYNTGCYSQSSSIAGWTGAGKYCGFCDQVLGNYVDSHIYQVNGGSGSGSCCDYGYNGGCAAEWSRHPYFRECANNARGY